MTVISESVVKAKAAKMLDNGVGVGIEQKFRRYGGSIVTISFELEAPKFFHPPKWISLKSAIKEIGTIMADAGLPVLSDPIVHAVIVNHPRIKHRYLGKDLVLEADFSREKADLVLGIFET